SASTTTRPGDRLDPATRGIRAHFRKLFIYGFSAVNPASKQRWTPARSPRQFRRKRRADPGWKWYINTAGSRSDPAMGEARRMPELPEVETMVRGIRTAVEGKRIAEFRRSPCGCRAISLRPGLAALKRRCEGQTVVAVRRRAKKILLELTSGEAFVIEPR